VADLEPYSADNYNASGVCLSPLPAGVFTILDNDQNIGRVPLGNATGVNYSVKIGSSLGGATRVFLRLNLSQTSNQITLSTTSFTFNHALGADRKSEHYSSDFPAGSGGFTIRNFPVVTSRWPTAFDCCAVNQILPEESAVRPCGPTPYGSQRAVRTDARSPSSATSGRRGAPAMSNPAFFRTRSSG